MSGGCWGVPAAGGGRFGPANAGGGRRGILIAVLLVAAAVGGIDPAAADRQGALGPEGDDPGDGIVLTQEFRLTPDKPGQIDVQWHFRIPDRVSDVKTRLPPDARNVRTTRFRLGEDGLYEWDGDTTTATITFTVPANETTDRTGPEAAEGQFRFVDTGDWALTRRPPVTSPGYTYPRGRDPGFTVRNTTAGEGVIGRSLLYLGPHETVERSAHGQRFRLVVPGAATLAADRGEILDSVADASDRLRVGDRDERVLMIAAPTSVPWGVLGLQAGQRDFYVLADQRPDAPDNTWLHEYVHTRQDFDTTEGTEWLFEATAEYYAAQMTLEQDRIDYSAFREYLERGTRQRFSTVRLVDPATWRDNSGNYLKGALVAGDLDRRIRVATNGSATFQEVFRRMNRQDSAVTHPDFLEYVRVAGGSDVLDPARRYTETTARPTAWSAESHGEAFGTLPPRFRYDLPDRGSDGLRVRSSYREGRLDRTELVPGETLVLDIAVENVGGSAGEYDLGVTVDGSPVATRTGLLEAGNSTTETVEYTFEEPGSYTISTGEDTLRVRVRDPATPVVTDLRTDSREVRPGERVRLTATVENPADRPAERDLGFRREGSTISSQQVRLAPGGSAEVTATASLSEAGTYRFGIADRSVTVTVVEPRTQTPTATPRRTGGTAGGDDNTGVSGPGFGPVGVLLALVVLASSLLVRQRLQ